MKSLFSTLIALILLMSAQIANAAIIVAPVTSAEFDEVFDYGLSRPVNGSGAEWYAQFQAGAIGSTDNTFEQWETEVGGPSGATDYGHTTWPTYPTLGTVQFSISMDNANNLTAIFNGVGAGDGFPTPASFNEIWIELRIDTSKPLDTLGVTNHTVDSSGLSNMEVTGSTVGNSVRQAFKFHFDDRLSNIGEFDLSGDMNFDVELNAGQSWTYTAVGVNNPDIVPEPSSLTLILLAATALFFGRNLYRKR